MSASAADLQFGQQLFTALLKSGVGPAGLVLSPLSVWFALVLVLNGAGACGACGWDCRQQQRVWVAG
jgi:hypothetical protein